MFESLFSPNGGGLTLLGWIALGSVGAAAIVVAFTIWFLACICYPRRWCRILWRSQEKTTRSIQTGQFACSPRHFDDPDASPERHLDEPDASSSPNISPRFQLRPLYVEDEEYIEDQE